MRWTELALMQTIFAIMAEVQWVASDKLRDAPWEQAQKLKELKSLI
jgi:hypothetical protein